MTWADDFIFFKVSSHYCVTIFGERCIFVTWFEASYFANLAGTMWASSCVHNEGNESTTQFSCNSSSKYLQRPLKRTQSRRRLCNYLRLKHLKLYTFIISWIFFIPIFRECYWLFSCTGWGYHPEGPCVDSSWPQGGLINRNMKVKDFLKRNGEKFCYTFL